MIDSWRVRPGRSAHLAQRDPASTESAPGGKAVTEAASAGLHGKLLSLQDRLWAENRRSVLVVLQGIDASGKDGTISHVFRGLNPLGTRLAIFKEPSRFELAHDFLWRVHAQVPAAGEIGIFNRSHYEDVLVVRVHKLVDERVWVARYEHINNFEALLAATGTTMVKIFLHLSKAEQGRRLEERRTRPTKLWKVRAADFAERELWDDYQLAFSDMLDKTSTQVAPWYVVPADHKWYRNWAVSQILLHTLSALDPRYPEPEPASA
jgi:PPK2 family polyphosphate:nucleotide phosphotransferase